MIPTELLSNPQALVGFGLGCAAGYAFATVTTQRNVRAWIERAMNDRDKRIADLEAEVKELRDRLMQ